ncbi:MAG: type II toxin-antitoxin system YafQ family toxin [Actinomycetes bacterium]|nr:type II toxin-antitoxin system YafQ family toxin [Actinomycetes bacterium]
MIKLGNRVLIRGARFKREYKQCVKKGLDVAEIDTVLRILVARKPPPSKYRDYALKGNYMGYHECHLKGDWLFIYKISGDDLIITAVRTGSHSELFNL